MEVEMKIYTIRDRIAEMCGPLFESKNDGVARRHFRQVLDKVVEYDQDAYELVEVGGWDPETGILVGLEAPRKVDAELPQTDDKQGELPI